ncbi:hypothetical protein H5410_025728 [Solanum commersonii]|uniref:Uncharacterized protein n=1 Tax=Solanum commersonii TaxID=4109 RepID=A0A9J5YYS5_SOLCO|nr:hypothetical protein H5410_025728 [Solanum commersonii]
MKLLGPEKMMDDLMYYNMTYVNVLQPVTNMEMWHVSTNPTVAPPEIKSMSGRIGKLRKKEAGKHSTKRLRGRPRGAAPISGPEEVKRKTTCKAPSASATHTKGARGRPPIAPAAPNASAIPTKSARGRPPAATSVPSTCPSPANYHVGSSTPTDYQLTNSNKGR